MTALRDTIVKLSRFICDWTPAEVAAMAEVTEIAAVRYCNQLWRKKILSQPSKGRFMAGPRIDEWRALKPKTRAGGAANRYLAAKALRATLVRRDWEVATGRLPAPGAKGIADGIAEDLTTQNSAEDRKLSEATQKTMEKRAMRTACCTIREAAAYLGVGYSTIEKRIKRGEIPICSEPQRRVMIPKTYLLEATRAVYRR